MTGKPWLWHTNFLAQPLSSNYNVLCLWHNLPWNVWPQSSWLCALNLLFPSLQLSDSSKEIFLSAVRCDLQFCKNSSFFCSVFHWSIFKLFSMHIMFARVGNLNICFLCITSQAAPSHSTKASATQPAPVLYFGRALWPKTTPKPCECSQVTTVL